ncbi:MAG: N-acetyl-gamma-glutamyl-phosphate reductase [Polyangiaceae bacterium]|nr:N-acetyl-gamma-glutamyl-phosphate reductase [Polyangiaceae bacterium]
MIPAPVGVVGASGYSGAVLVSLLARHPGARLVFATSDKRAGERVSDVTGADTGELRFSPNGSALELAAGCDVALLATSAEVSLDLAPRLLAANKRVVDLSGAFRLRDAAEYPRWYRLEHRHPELLAEAHYGCFEIAGPPPAGARLVANPGCYPTAALLSVAPLLSAGLAEPRGVVVDAKSGVTGAGRQAKEEYSLAEAAGDLRAYKLLSHQHTPEIEQRAGAKITFTAHLLPIRRGILTTSYLRPRGGATTDAVMGALERAYEGSPFVRVMPPERVRITGVAGTNQAHVGAVADADVVVVTCAIDNLVKGAAGQAVENLNLLLGLPRETGLLGLPRFAP